MRSVVKPTRGKYLSAFLLFSHSKNKFVSNRQDLNIFVAYADEGYKLENHQSRMVVPHNVAFQH